MPPPTIQVRGNHIRLSGAGTSVLLTAVHNVCTLSRLFMWMRIAITLPGRLALPKAQFCLAVLYLKMLLVPLPAGLWASDIVGGVIWWVLRDHGCPHRYLVCLLRLFGIAGHKRG